MPPVDPHAWDIPLLEVPLWGIALVCALVRLRHTPANERRGWWLIAAGLLLIVLDKAIDVHEVLHEVARWLAVSIDPEHNLRGPNAIYRNLALLLGLLGAGGLSYAWVRRDAHVGRGKLLCLGGLFLVGALLAVRLMPKWEVLLSDQALKIVELLAWLLVVLGEWLGRRPPPQPAGPRDGFL